jgi:arabinogalactan oligomer/maltooligosaccharide transport system substrate-binding protein
VLSGGGPDLYISTNDEIYNWSKDGFILEITQYIENEFEQIIPVGIEGMEVEGSVFGIPQSFHTVALYYKKSLVEQPPQSTDELLQLINEGKRVVLVSSSYHLFGWANAFGGKLMNEEGKCIADQNGWVDFLQYLQNLKEAGAEFVKDVNTAEYIFLEEDAAMIINGSWVLEEYDQILKGDLGVAPIPIGPLNKAAPLVTVDGFYFNPNSDNVEESIKLAIFLTNKNSSQIYSKLAKRIPARKDVILDDPNLEVFRLAAEHGEAMPNIKEFINYWIPFDDMIHSVLEGSVNPRDGVAIACATMNSINNK